MNRIKNIGLIILSIGILIFFLLWLLYPNEKIIYKPNPQVSIVYKDSIIYREETRIRNIAKINYRDSIIYDLVNNIPDTIKIETSPFVACLDTIAKDTINVKYSFPENTFDLRIRYYQDTLKIPEITIIKEKEKTFFEKYLEKPVYIAGGLIVGFLLGNSK